MSGHEGQKKSPETAADEAPVEADITDDDIVESLDAKAEADDEGPGEERLDLADEADVELVAEDAAVDEDTPTRDLRAVRPGALMEKEAPEEPAEAEEAAEEAAEESRGGVVLDSLDEPVSEEEVARDATTGQHPFAERGAADDPDVVQDLSEASDPAGLELGDEETTGEFDHAPPPEDATGPNRPGADAAGAEPEPGDEPGVGPGDGLEPAPEASDSWAEDDTNRSLEARPHDPDEGQWQEPSRTDRGEQEAEPSSGRGSPAAEPEDQEATPPPEPSSPARTRSRRRRPAPSADAEASGDQGGAGDRDFLEPPKPLEQSGAAPRHRASAGRSWSEVEPAPQVSLQSDEPLPSEQEVASGDSTRVEPFGQGAAVASEKTLIFGKESIAAEPEPPVLVIVKGDEEGREVELTQDQYTLGRGPDNDLVFPDIACSRRHAQVIRDGDAWYVEDLGSGNGTLLNGQKVQRTQLQDGDEIEVGNTILEFHDPAAAQGAQENTADEDDDLREPEPTAGGRTTILSGGVLPEGGTSPGFVTRLLADPKRKKLVIIGGGALGGLFLLMLIIKLVAPGPPPGPTPEELERQARMEARRQFDKNMDAAKEAVKEKRWRDAADAVKAAEEIDPSNPMVASYKSTIQIESSSAVAMARVEALMESKEWDKAVAALQGISPESELKDKVATLKKEIDARLLEDLLAQANLLVSNKQYNQAIIKFNDVLMHSPGHEEALVAKRNAEELLEKEQRQPVRPSGGGSKRKKRVSTPQPAAGLSGQALALYKNGEIDRALDKAENGGASGDELARLRKFKAAYEKVSGQGAGPGNPGKAVEALQAALKLDQQIAGGAGEYHKQLSQKLAKAYFVKGVDAMQSRRMPEAYQSFRSAQKYDSNLPKVQERLADLAKEAKKLYEESYVIKATNQDLAISKLKVAIQIVPPDDIYYNKAKKLLGTLTGEGGGSDDGDGF